MHSLTGSESVLSELYFSNNTGIVRLTNESVPLLVIPDLRLADAIECNACDGMIYWIDQGPPAAIRRALPGNPDTVETVSFLFGFFIIIDYG